MNEEKTMNVNEQSEAPMSGAARASENMTDPMTVTMPAGPTTGILIPIDEYKQMLITMHEMTVALTRATNLINTSEDTQKELLKKARKKFIKDFEEDILPKFQKSSMLQKKGNVFKDCTIKAVVTDPDEDTEILGTHNHDPFNYFNPQPKTGLDVLTEKLIRNTPMCSPMCGSMIAEGGELYTPNMGISQKLCDVLNEADSKGEVIVDSYVAASFALQRIITYSGPLAYNPEQSELSVDEALFQVFLNQFHGTLSDEYVAALRKYLNDYCNDPNPLNYGEAMEALMNIAFFVEIAYAFDVYEDGGESTGYIITPELIEVSDPDLNMYEAAMVIMMPDDDEMEDGDDE